MSFYEVARRCRHVEHVQAPQVLTRKVELNRWLYARQEENCSACVAAIKAKLAAEHREKEEECNSTN